MTGDTIGQVAKWLVIVGGINWGLTGVGGFIGTDLNVVGLVLGGIAGGVIANIVYVLVGLGALWQLKAVMGK